MGCILTVLYRVYIFGGQRDETARCRAVMPCLVCAATSRVLTTFARKPRLESSLDCLICVLYVVDCLIVDVICG